MSDTVPKCFAKLEFFNEKTYDCHICLFHDQCKYQLMKAGLLIMDTEVPEEEE